MSEPIQCQSDDPNLAGVAGGNSSTGNGVYGWSQGTDGVRGVSLSPEHAGVAGTNDHGGYGVFAETTGLDAVRGINHSPEHAGVAGTNDRGGYGVFGESPNGIGVSGRGKTAGFFEGDVTITGDLKVRGVSLGTEQIQALGQQVTGLQQQVTSLHQLVNNLEAQLASLQSKQAKDEQDTAVAVATLAARITKVGG